jgi:VanZ family protein
MLRITARNPKVPNPKALPLIPAPTPKKDAMAALRPNRQTLVLKFWLPVLACMGFIFYMSGVPGSDIPPLFPFQDIIYHFFLYSVLAYLFARALKNTSCDIRPFQLLFFSVLFSIFYGITDELHQAFVPGRCVSGFDIFINSSGGITGSSVYQWLKSSLLRH